MKTPLWLAASASLVALWPLLSSAQLQITEVLAMPTPDDDGDNPEKFLDEDEHLSDMIEIYNPTDATIKLGGYRLTDEKKNPSKWTFPSNQNIEAGEYKIVYASAKNKRGLFNAVAHTNFKLGRDGDYLALISPEGEILSEYDKLPEMYANTSFGPEGHMTSTTFGAANKPGLASPTHKVKFSVSSRTFAGELVLELSSDDLPAGARIGYTTNGGEPIVSLFSPPKYYDVTGPITIKSTTSIRARIFEDGKLPGSIKTENYFLVNDELAEWSSNLPVVVVESFGSRYTKNRFSESAIMFLEPKSGDDPEATKRTSIIQEAEIESRMKARQRGSSTGGWPKKSLALETWFDDANGADRDITPFGMPANGDWVLSGRYDFDRALIRNPLAYQISTEMGHWAPRTQFVEVFMNEDGGEIDAGDYAGVYTFMEKVELSEDRINIQEPTGFETGGFMVKVDRNSTQSGTRDVSLRSNAAGGSTVWIEPEKEFVESGQNNWLTDRFNLIKETIRDDDLAEDPENGYRSLIDTESWIDESMVRMLARDPDAFRLSTYLYMPRNGKVHYGPVWDFDRTMGCDQDTRARDPEAWTQDWGTYGWYNDLLGREVRTRGALGKRPDFWQEWIDRYHRHRRTVLSTENIDSIIDDMAGQIAEGQVRNFERWRGQRPDAGNVKDYNDGVTGWEGEIVHLKGWLKARVEWIDDQFTPEASITGGLYEAGEKVPVSTGGTLFAKQDAYYTTDGSDPRLPGGALNPKAIKIDANTGIVTNESLSITLRAEKSGSPWSSPIRTAIVIDGVHASSENLLVSEIMYHPLDGSEQEQGSGFHHEDTFEYIELMNVGETPMFLGDLEFTSGISYLFSESEVQLLAPGERMVLVSDAEAFELRYGSDLPVGGEYIGQLANNGERIALMRGEEVIQDFSYNDREPWPVTPDQFGFSLTLTNPMSGLDLSDAKLWTVDLQAGGSPGSAAIVPPAVVVNEVLANSGANASDAIELLNKTAGEVDLSGWFLSDDADEPNKFVIPAGTTVASGDVVVFRQDNDNDPTNNSELPTEFFGNAFGLNSIGDTVYLFSATEDGELSGYRDRFAFNDAEEGSSFGRVVTSSGESQVALQEASSIGAPNVGPIQSPLVITEIMYNPPAAPLAGAEYVEVQNQSSAVLNLSLAGNAAESWRVAGINFTFPENVTLAAGEIALIVSVETEAFRTAYNVPAPVKIYGPFAGNLSNGGESIRLQRPFFLSGGEVPVVRHATVDRVVYNDKAPWPADADGGGASIERTKASDYGNDSANWRSSVGGTPGSYTEGEGGGDPQPEPNAGLTEWLAAEFSEAERGNAAVSGLSADPDGDGLVNLAEYTLNTSPKATDPAPLEVVEVAEGNASYLSVSFIRRQGAAVSVGLEGSADLDQWATINGVEESVQALGDGVERVTLRDSQDRSGNVSRYVRLRMDAN